MFVIILNVPLIYYLLSITGNTGITTKTGIAGNTGIIIYK